MKTFFLSLLTLMLIAFTACNNSETKKTAANNLEQAQGTIEKAQVVKSKSIHITKAEFLDKVWDFEANSENWEYKGDKPCIIDFYADWCGPCKIAAPLLEELAIEYSDKIYVYKIDTEKERELAGAFGIRSIPAFLYCPTQGKPQMTAGIGRTPEETKEMFKNMIDNFLLTQK